MAKLNSLLEKKTELKNFQVFLKPKIFKKNNTRYDTKYFL